MTPETVLPPVVDIQVASSEIEPDLADNEGDIEMFSLYEEIDEVMV